MASKQNQDQMNELQRKNLEAAMRLAQMSIENSQRIMELQVETAKGLFEEGVNNARALSTATDRSRQWNCAPVSPRRQPSACLPALAKWQR